MAEAAFTVYNRSMVLMQCGQCGVEFCIPQRLNEEHREAKTTWYCPNGHPRVYARSLRDTISSLQKDLSQAVAARDELEAKLRRAQNGVCPECRRHFKNLNRHMQHKHPKTVLT